MPYLPAPFSISSILFLCLFPNTVLNSHARSISLIPPLILKVVTKGYVMPRIYEIFTETNRDFDFI